MSEKKELQNKTSKPKFIRSEDEVRDSQGKNSMERLIEQITKAGRTMHLPDYQPPEPL